MPQSPHPKARAQRIPWAQFLWLSSQCCSLLGSCRHFQALLVYAPHTGLACLAERQWMICLGDLQILLGAGVEWAPFVVDKGVAPAASHSPPSKTEPSFPRSPPLFNR